MKECLSCCLVSMLIGAVVGGVLVVSNKKVENVVKKGKDMAVEKMEEKTKKPKTAKK